MARADARGMSKTTMSTPATPGPASAAFTGMYVPLVTPFDAEGAVAFEALERLAHEVLDAGASGLVALGTTAEPASLTPGEQSAVQERIARVCRERAATMMVGASTVRAVQALHGTEATVALSLVPPFQRPGEAGTVAHFEALAAASPVPLIVYHVPYRTGQPLSAAAIRQLARIPGMRPASSTPPGRSTRPPSTCSPTRPPGSRSSAETTRSSRRCSPSAHTAASWRPRTLPPGSSPTWPPPRTPGDAATAQGLGRRLAPLSAALFAEPNPTVIKAVLHARGRIPTPDVRLPLLPAAPASLATATKSLDA